MTRLLRRVALGIAVTPSVLIALAVATHLAATWSWRWYWRRGVRVPRVIREAEGVALRARRTAWRRP